MGKDEDNRTSVRARSQSLHWAFKLSVAVLVVWVGVVCVVAISRGAEEASQLACCGSIAPLLLVGVLGNFLQKKDKGGSSQRELDNATKDRRGENALRHELESAKEGRDMWIERAAKLASELAKLRQMSETEPQCSRCRAKIELADASFCPRCGHRLL